MLIPSDSANLLATTVVKSAEYLPYIRVTFYKQKKNKKFNATML